MLRYALNELGGLGNAPKLADAVLDLLPDSGVMVIDPDLRVVLMRGHVYERHGIDVRLAVGRDLPDVLPATAWARLGEHWHAALAGERRTLDSERGIPSRRVVDGLRVVEVDDVFSALLTLELTPPL